MLQRKAVKSNGKSEGPSHIKLSVVATGSKENEEFFKYTPSVTIEMGVVNSEAAKQFKVGKEYYIDISLVE